MAEYSHNEAVWSGGLKPHEFPGLSQDVEADVAIVGGGITGISTAFNLARAGKKVVVLEARKVGYGTTGSSTGNLYATVNEHLYQIVAKFDADVMRAVAKSRKAAIDFIEERINEFEIKCEFERVPWFLFTTQKHGAHVEQVQKEFHAAENAGLPVSDMAPALFPYQVSAITHLSDQAQFNPLSYVQQLAAAIAGENCRIFENTRVVSIEDGDPCVVATSRGKVRAQKIVQATHSPKGIYAVHTAMQVFREYAFAVRLNGDLPEKGIYWHLHENQLYSVRPYASKQGNFLIVLDASQKLGHTEHTENNFKKVEDYMMAHFDVAHIEYSWAAQNYKSADTLPYIGSGPTEKNIFIASGFGPDGLTYGTLASMIISDLITGKENRWAEIYNPMRFTPGASAKRFLRENIDVAKNMLKDYLLAGYSEALEEIGTDEGEVIKIEGKKVAAYRDAAGQLHLRSAICTHAGCVVHWNNAEKSWDCPCHGSRFSVDGEVLEGPAFYDLKKVDIKEISGP